MTITIRPAVPADYPALNALYDAIHAQHVAALPGIFRMPEGPVRSRATIARLIAGPDSALFLAEVDGQPAGLVDVRLHDAPDRPDLVPRRFAMVETLVVASAYRRRGVGRALMAQAQAWAQEHGLTGIILSVWEFNSEALAFYEALGYRTALRRLQLTLEEG